MVRHRICPAKHVPVQVQGGTVIGLRSVSSDHASVKINIGGVEVIEDETSIVEVEERKSTEANKLESVKLCLGMAEGYEKGLELF